MTISPGQPPHTSGSSRSSGRRNPPALTLPGPGRRKQEDLAMTQYGTWVSYSGTARLALTAVLLAAAQP
jgi:hypothetical protein